MLEPLKTGTPIWVYYIDIDTGENLMVPQLMRGITGFKYHVEKKEFPRYRFVKAIGPVEGTFSMQQQKSVKLYYRHVNWQKVEDVDVYLMLDHETTIYDSVKGMPLSYTLPSGIVVKAFHRVNTENGDSWYELGADQWVKYEQMRVVNNPYLNDEGHSPITDQLTILPLKNVHGTIDYLPNREIDVYDAPYGKKIGAIADGEHVNILGKLDDQGEITWYQIGRHRFVTSNYVDIDNEE